MARIALIVGVDFYGYGDRLHGCVNDAYEVKSILERHDGGAVNFECKLMSGTGQDEPVKKHDVRDAIRQLFETDAEIALFYFAGHGHVNETGGYILTSDSTRGDDGISLSEVVNLANRSKARNKIIVLDSCHSGIAGDLPNAADTAVLADGLTILTASTKEQYASEESGHGIFTGLFVDALAGSAANLTGDISPGSIYAHIDQSLGVWEQRPVFKTNVRQFVSLRKTAAPIDLDDLRAISVHFPRPGYEFKLDPTFEPELRGRDVGLPEPDPENVRVFGLLQQYNRLNLLVPVGAPHMWHAAMEGKGCRLTALGEHYRRLAEKGRI